MNKSGEPYREDDLTIAWSVVVSVFSIGGMLGSLIAGFLADLLGRRLFMFILAIGGVLSGIILGISKIAESLAVLIIGRFFVGFVSGAYTGLVPMYLMEVAPQDIRGSIGVFNQFSIVCALLISQALGLYEVLGNENGWPLLFGLTAVPAAVQVLFVLFICPESPRYLLITKNNEQAARDVLNQVISNADETDAAITEMKEEAEALERELKVGIYDFVKRAELRFPILIAIVMQLSQQFSGINGIFYYSKTLFIKSGIDEGTAEYATLGVGATMIVTTAISIPLMERLGRKILHCTGIGGMFTAAVLVTVFLAIRDQYSWAGTVGVVFSLVFVMFFAIGPGSIPWIITSELFTQGARPGAIAIATFVNWSANFVVGMTFEPLINVIDQYVFVIFAVLLLGFLFFTIFFVPETKGKSFQEIQRQFVSPNYQSTVSSSVNIPGSNNNNNSSSNLDNNNDSNVKFETTPKE